MQATNVMHYRSRLMVSALVSLAMLGTACDWLTDPSPDQAHVVLEGDADAQVSVVVSTKFVAGQTEDQRIEVRLLASDTTLRSLPFDTTYTIRDDQRFFLEVGRPDSVSTPSVEVRVLLDGEERFWQSRVLSDEPIRFTYLFNHPPFTVVEVL